MPGLVRAIRRWDLVALVINAVIGAGIFGLPAEVFKRIGPFSLIAFGVCAIVTALIVACFMEVSSRFSDTGGPYLYAREAFGPVAGFEVGWLTYIARLTAFAANCNLFVGYLGFFWPAAGGAAARAAVIAAVVAGLTMVNLSGVRHTAKLSNVFTVAKLVPLVLFVGVGLWFVRPAAYDFHAAPAFGTFTAAAMVLIYAFTGFEMATIPGGESRDPRRDLPRALLTGIAVIATLYVLIQVVAIGTLPGLATSTRPLADAGATFLGGMGGAIISAGALVSIIGNLNVLLFTASRLPFAMAERGELPRFLASTHRRFHTPHWAVLATAAAMFVLTVSGTFVYAATISVIARLLGYMATCAALPRLRMKRGAPEALLKVPGGPAIAGVALVLIGWLLSQCSAQQARDAGIAAAVGIALYGISVWRRPRAAG